MSPAAMWIPSSPTARCCWRSTVSWADITCRVTPTCPLPLFDEGEGKNEEDFVHKISDKEYLVEGSVNLDDFNDHLELNLESEEYDSLGGFIIEHLDRLPELGDSVTTSDGIRLVVESLDKNRIEKVHVYLPEKVEYDEDSEE